MNVKAIIDSVATPHSGEWMAQANTREAAERTYFRVETSGKPAPDLEPILAAFPWTAWQYADNILRKAFPAGEKAISTDAWISLAYAEGVLKGPFPAGEKVMLENEECFQQYLNFLHTTDLGHYADVCIRHGITPEL